MVGAPELRAAGADGLRSMTDVLRILAIPGRDETVHEAFGALRLFEGRILRGLDWGSDLAGRPFATQVRVVSALLASETPDEDSLVLGRSFGAWLVLNALIERDRPYPGTVVLLASVLGYGAAGGLGFKAARARAFWSEVERRGEPPARRLVLVHADDDEQCPCEYAARLSSLWRVPLERLPRGGHALGKSALVDEVSSIIAHHWSAKP